MYEGGVWIGPVCFAQITRDALDKDWTGNKSYSYFKVDIAIYLVMGRLK